MTKQDHIDNGIPNATPAERATAMELLRMIQVEEAREISFYSHAYDQLMHAISLRQPPTQMLSARLESTGDKKTYEILGHINEVLGLLASEADKMGKQLEKTQSDITALADLTRSHFGHSRPLTLQEMALIQPPPPSGASFS